MNFLIAPNALKGSLSAVAAAKIIAKALQEISSDNRSIICPVADGGNGTLDCLVDAKGGKIFTLMVSGPLSSMAVSARWGILSDGTTAVIEMAEAAGIHLLKPHQYDAAHATTFGVGELVHEAMKSGCKRIIIGLGGSATNDGGAGCAKALGVKFFDRNNNELADGGIHLSQLHHIEMKNFESGVKNCEFIALSDVKNLLCGPKGASFTFGPQKEATEDQVRELDKGLDHYASIIEREIKHDISRIPGSGAAGGLGAGLTAFCDATIVSGIEFVLDAVRFDDLLLKCDCVITAEGSLDGQTLQGKGIEGIARRASKINKPVHVFAGNIRGDADDLRKKLGLATLDKISPEGMPVEEAMKNAEAFLSEKIRDTFSTKSTKDTKK